MKLPTQRSLESWRKEGWMCAKTEHWNQWAKCRQDLFHFIDVVALRDGDIVALQCTTGTNHSARVKKIISDPIAAPFALGWLKARGRIYVCSWGLRANKGKRKSWVERREEITVERFMKESE